MTRQINEKFILTFKTPIEADIIQKLHLAGNSNYFKKDLQLLKNRKLKMLEVLD